ncbi:hypothetical protein L9F63_016340 [Diploptera punctata]|uniref:Ionotropic glutamate receptor C-terminal domain-containing protein n=1 Tax=Diploptera punctata TaxID=6984 RepID=A0AAD8A172_DIPPU|nr:hypothetical protein L9F63_016340 [Diploptera punctata]
MNKKQRHLVRSVIEVVIKHFKPEEPIVITLPDPDYKKPPTGRLLFPSETHGSSLIVARSIIKSLIDMFRPVYVMKTHPSNIVPSIIKKLSGPKMFQQYLITFMPFGDNIANFAKWLGYTYESLQITVQTYALTESENPYVRLVFYMFNYLLVCNTIFIIPSSQNIYSNTSYDQVLKVYSWRPFNVSGQCGKLVQPNLINEWIFDGNGGFVKDIEFFSTIIPKSMFRNCPIDIIQTSKFIRIGKNYESPPVENYLLSETLSIIFDYMRVYPVYQDKISSMIVGTIPFNNFEDFTTLYVATYPYLITHIQWHVPCPERRLDHGNFIKVFSVSLWLLVFLMALVVVVFVWRFNKTWAFFNITTHYENLSFCFLNVLAILSGISAENIPPSIKLRSIFASWICFCLMIGTVFQAFFTSYLVEPGFSKQISSIDELNNTKNELIAPLFQLYIWSHRMKSMEYIYLMKGHRSCFNTAECMRDFFSDKSSSLLLSSVNINLISNYLSNRIKFCYLEDKSMTVYYSIHVLKRSVYFKFINDAIGRIVESGIMYKLENDLHVLIKNNPQNFPKYLNLTKVLQETLENSTDSVPHSSDGYYSFNVTHMKIAFYLLGMGLLVSIVTLIVENIYYLANFK